MAIYTAILPNGQPYQIQGPENASAEDIQAAGLQLYTQTNPAPYVDSGERDYSLGTAGSKAVSRGMERVKSTFGDVIPAMVGNVFGADEYVKRQMYEAEASQDLINRKYRAELQSYKDVQSIGDAIKFGVETIGEQAVNLGVMAVPGIGLGQAAKIGATKLAASQLAKRQATAQGIGVYLGSYALNAPEVFQNIYQETGELATGTSLLFGAAAASLDAILPATIIKKITPLQKLGIAKAVIKKSGARPGLVESVFKGLAKGAATEGVTEGMQEAISISAENFVAGNPQIFESEDWDRIMEASVRGAVAGGGFRGISSPFERPAAEPKPLTRAELENQRFVAEEAAAAEVAAAAAEKLAKEKPAKEKPAKEKPAPAAEVTPKVEIEQAADEIFRAREAGLVAQAAELGLDISADGQTASRFDAGEQEVTYKIINNRWEKQDESTTIDAADRDKTLRRSDALPLESATGKTAAELGSPVGGKVEVDTGTVSPTGERADVSDVALTDKEKVLKNEIARKYLPRIEEAREKLRPIEEAEYAKVSGDQAATYKLMAKQEARRQKAYKKINDEGMAEFEARRKEAVSDVALDETVEQEWDDMSVSGVPFNALKKEDQLRLTEAQQDGELTGQLVDEIDSAAAQTFAGLTFVKEGEKYGRYKAKEGFIDKDGRPQGGKEFIEDFYRQDEIDKSQDTTQESRTDTEGTGQTTETVTTELVEEFGNNVNKTIEKGKLVIVDNVSQLPDNVTMSSTANGAFDKKSGISYLVANRIQKGQARRLLLHEIGEHYGLEKMVGKDYMPMLNRLKTLRKQNADVQTMFDEVQRQYPELEVNSKPFLQEVMAKLGERAPNNTLFRRMVGAVKNFLRRLGLYNVNNFNDADIQDMILNSLRVSLAEATGTVTREQVSGIPALQMSKRTYGTAEADNQAIINMIRKEYLAEMDEMPDIVIKEMLQNGADAIKPLIERGEMEGGNIDIKVNPEARSITMRDDGVGMTEETLAGVFLRIGGTLKEITKTGVGGGYGLAKSILLYGSGDINVITMRDGKIHQLKTTGETLINAFVEKNLKSIPIDTYTIQEFQTEFSLGPTGLGPMEAMFPKGHGTQITVTIPETYVDPNEGTTETIRMPYSPTKALKNSPLFQNIIVTFERIPMNEKTDPFFETGEGITLQEVNIGQNFLLDEFIPIFDVPFKWGNVKVYKSINKDPSLGYNINVLSNGLYQFQDYIPLDPKRPTDDVIPYQFYIDVSPTKPAGDPSYPFSPDRRRFTESAAKDIEVIKNGLYVLNANQSLKDDTISFGGVEQYTLNRDGSITVSKKILLSSEQKEGLLPEGISEGTTVEIKDGKLVIGNKKVPIRTPEDLAKAVVSSADIVIPEGAIDPKKVTLHNNVETALRVSEDGDLVDATTLALASQNQFAPIQEVLREAFPTIVENGYATGFDAFINEIGASFIILRDQVVRLGEAGLLIDTARNYKELNKAAIGVSIDTEYAGVNLMVPFEGAFVNPFMADALFEIDPALLITSEGTRRLQREAGYGISGTMVHELAHYQERNHDARFTKEMQKLSLKLKATEKFVAKNQPFNSFGAIEKRINKAVEKNFEMIKVAHEILKNTKGENRNVTRLIGQRFKDGIRETSAESVPKNMVTPREKGLPGRDRIPGDTRKGDTTGERERQLESVSPESKTTQESRVDTSDVAEIIDYGGVDRGQAEGVLNTINTTIKKLGLADTAAGKFILDKLSLVPAYLAERYVSLLSIPNKIELFAKELPALKKIATYLQNKAHDIKVGREQVNVLLEDAKVLREQYNKTQKGQKIWTEWNTVLLNLSKENINPETIINDPEARAELERPISKDAAGNEFYNDKGIALIERYEKLPKDLRDLGKLVALDLKTRYELLLDTMVKAYPSAETQLREKFTTLDYYLPMVRKGDHWFKYITEEGEEGKASATSPFLREQMKKKLREQGATQFENFSQQELAQVSGGAPAAFVENVKSAILKNEKVDKKSEAAVLETIEEQYLALFPEQSLRNQETHRKGIPGYINDIMFAYADTVPKIIASTANAKYNADIIKASNEVSEDAVDSENAIVKAIGKDTIKSVPFYLNPVANPWAAMPAYVSYVWFLGGNISSAFVNLTQLPLIVLPFLQGEYTFDKSQKALFDAIKLYTEGGFEENRVFLPDRTAAPFKLDPKTGEKIYTGKNAKLFVKGGRYYQLFKDAEQAAALRRGVGYEITELRKNLGDEVKSGTRIKTKVDAAVGYVFQNSERINREVTLMAAFDLEMKYGSKNEAKAIQKAIELTSKVHSHSLPEMGPRLFQDGLGKVTFVFKRFAQAQVYLAGKLFKDVFGTKPKNKEEREARDIAARQLIGVYGYSFLMAGVQGMPFYGAATVLASLLFDDEDEPFDPHTVVNQAIGDIAYRGPLSQLMGVDISQRTGFRDLVFREDPARLEKIGAAAYMLEVIGGPGYSIVRKGFEGMGMVANGEIGRGAERMLPTALANTIKTVRYNTDGMTNRYGAPIIEGDPSVYESFMQILGFTNIELSEAYTEANALKGPERKLQQRKSRLLLKYFLAKQTGDAGGMESIQKEIDSFNNKAPASFRITPSVRNRSMKARERKVKDSVHGVYQGANIRAELEEKYLNN